MPNPLPPHPARGARLVGIVLTACVALTGCGQTVNGSAHPAADLGTSAPATTSATTPALIPAAAATEKLLTRGELAQMVNGTDMVEVEAYSGPDATILGFEPFDCHYRALAASSSGYHLDTLQATAGNTNRAKDSQVAAQVIAVFANRAEPEAMLNVTKTGWTGCPDGEAFTVASTDGPQHWVAKEVTDDGDRISSLIEREDSAGRTCRHVMARRANITVEAIACGEGDTTSQANAIADRLLQKFPD